MLEAQIDITEADKRLRRIAAKLGDRRNLHATWGQSVARVVKRNARAKGGRSFWADIARATRVAQITNSGATVGTYHVAAAQKQYGGVIEAKNAKALTIPIAPEAKGKRAAEFETGGRDLFVLKSKSADPNKKGILGYAEPDGSFHGLFALRKRTRRQRPDLFWPDENEISRLGVREAEYWLKHQVIN